MTLNDFYIKLRGIFINEKNMISSLALSKENDFSEGKKVLVTSILGIVGLALYLLVTQVAEISSLGVFLFFFAYLGFLIILSPESGFHIIIISVMVFERWFALAPITLGNLVVKIYPLDVVLIITAFFDKVITENPEISAYFPLDEETKRKEWHADVATSIVPETGILKLSVYAQSPEAAQAILTEVISVLEKEGPAYLGGHSSVSISQIDAPLALNFPARPNYFINILGGAFVGFLLGITYVFIEAEFFGKPKKFLETPKTQQENSVPDSDVEFIKNRAYENLNKAMQNYSSDLD